MQYRGDETTGFPSPARDYLQPVVDLAEILSLRDPGIYAVRVEGEGIPERAIRKNDILVADTCAEALPGKVAILFTPDEALLGTLVRVKGVLHAAVQNRVVPLDDNMEIWAIATRLVRTNI